MYTAQELIERRKELWERHKDIEKDAAFREAVADSMKKDPDQRREIMRHPDNIIEIFFVVVDKNQKTVPFVLNEVQRKFSRILSQAEKDFEEGKVNHIAFLVLKGRQQGFTTYITARQYARCITERNFAGYTIADKSENSETIFEDKAKFIHDHIPDFLKPTERFNSRREFHFQRKDGGGLNSRWRINTAENRDAGRSKTLNFFHGSEAAFWPELKGLLTGMQEALTANCVKVLESTANGFNDFRDLWNDENNWTGLFFEWWETSEYRLRFESKGTEREFKDNVLNAVEQTNVDDPMWCFWRCKWLLEVKELDWSQLYWYYNKWMDKREMVKQEYPCSAEEAFLASGRNYFDTEKVIRQLDYVRSQGHFYKEGNFRYSYINDPDTHDKLIDDSTIEFVEEENGLVRIYVEPKEFVGYSIGGDTASDGADYNVAYVTDHAENMMATVWIDKDEDLFADYMYCLGKRYNEALIAPEVNHSTHPTKVLLERQYWNMYVREEAPDSISGRLQKKYGYNTNKANRPVMLGEIRTQVRERIEKIVDDRLLNQMLTFIIDEKSKPVAEEGKHDDAIMAWAITNAIREQQPETLKSEPRKLKGFYTRAELEDKGYSDWEIEQYMEGQTIFERG